MIPYFRSLLAVFVLLILAGCNATNQDKPSDPPASFSVVAGDGQVAIEWDEQPGLQYYLFVAAASSISTSDFSSGKTALPESRIVFPLTRPTRTRADGKLEKAPYYYTGLTNGKTYSFLINATKDGGPAGPATTSISAVPRVAGINWQTGSAISTESVNSSSQDSQFFLTVGDKGNIFTSEDLKSWTKRASGTDKNLNGVDHNDSTPMFVAVGDAGTILTSDGTSTTEKPMTWTARSSNTGEDLVALAEKSNGQFVAVGEKGTIVLSNDNGSTWSVQASNTSKDLYSVVSTAAGYIAVGAEGTLLTSTDGAKWTAQNTGTTKTLYNIALFSGRYVAVGEGGTIITSTDAIAWAAANATTTQTLYGLESATQLVAVGAAGTILNSSDGLTWKSVTSNTTTDLLDVAFLSGVYLAVGKNGVNLVAR